MNSHQLWRLQHYVAIGFTVGEISWGQIRAGASKSSHDRAMILLAEGDVSSTIGAR